MVAAPPPARAFWLLGFSTADTVPTGQFAAIAGTGGQYSSVGSPAYGSFTPFLAHAGIRYGLTDNFDIGYRLTTLPLPFSSVGPTLGGEIDGKLRLTPRGNPFQAAIIAGMGYAYLQLQGAQRNAYSPGVDLTLSRRLGSGITGIAELRYVYTAIPSAVGGATANAVSAAGVDLGSRIAINQRVGLVPELGLFRLNGAIGGRDQRGYGLQYGVVLSFKI